MNCIFRININNTADNQQYFHLQNANKHLLFAKHPYITNPRRLQSHTDIHTHIYMQILQCGLHIPPPQHVGAGSSWADPPVEMWVLQLRMHPCHCLCPAKRPAMGRRSTRPHTHPGKLCTHAAPALCVTGWVKAAPAPHREVLGLARQEYRCHRVTTGSVQSGSLLLIPLQDLSLHILQIFRFVFRFTHFLCLFVIPWLTLTLTG